MQDSESEAGESRSENDVMIAAELGVTASGDEGHEPSVASTSGRRGGHGFFTGPRRNAALLTP